MKIRNCVGAAMAAAAVLLGAAQAQAAIITDVVWVVDTSSSMGDDIAQVKARIQEFDTAMQANGIDARYALVRFGGANTLIQDLTDYATFVAPGSPFQTVTANAGNPEDGSGALQVALTASFRANATRNFILVTDENDDVPANRAALDTALAATAETELINVIRNPNDDDLGYYANLATANGGNVFDILAFRANPQPFFTNFVNTKVQEIIDDFCTRNPTDPSCVNQVPEPGYAALLGLGVAGVFAVRRRR